jgi:hypothetical protein
MQQESIRVGSAGRRSPGHPGKLVQEQIGALWSGVVSPFRRHQAVAVHARRLVRELSATAAP